MNEQLVLFPIETLKIKTHVLHTTVIDESQDAYPEQRKGHGRQAGGSFEFLMCQWLCDSLHDRPCTIKANI